MRAQKPPNFLDRMQSTYMKQVAFNQRIIAAEEEISGINCDIADFVSEMSLDPLEEVIICVNGSQEMKRGENEMAGQLWVLGDRKMSVSNPPLPGMPNTKDAAVLSAVADAVSWKNEALEPADPPRRGKRVVVYPKELSHLDTVINSGDPSVEADHEIAYQLILEHAQTFEVPPVFIKEDADSVAADPVMSLKVPSWMCMAERIATGSRKRVTEDGPDTWHSDDESKADVEADKEANMYTSEMDPLKGPQMLSSRQAFFLRVAAQASKAPTSASSSDVSSDFGNSIVSSPVSTRSPTPLNSDDDDSMSADQQRALNLGKKMGQRSVPRSPSAPGLKKATGGAPGTRSGAVPESPMPDPTKQTMEPKAAASQRAPADQPKGAKAPPPTKGQQVPNHPMETRRGSRAGGLRGVDGSGQTQGCGHVSPPSKPGS
jgi:hypothetical protein